MEDSIRAAERERGEMVHMQEIQNQSTNTPLRKQDKKMFSNPRNKENIADFLYNDWIDKEKSKLRESQELVLAGGLRNVRESVIILTRDSGSKAFDLSSDHEEADSIVPQLSKCLKYEAVWGVLTDQMI